jgi:hypothetical protein
MPTEWAAGRVGLACIAFVVWAGGSVPARAQMEYSFDASVGRSDNILRTADDARDETIASVGAQFGWLARSPRLTADVLADLAYLDYRDGTLDGEVAGNLMGGMKFHVVPDRFDWVAEENFGQARRDPLAPVTPQNRENVNLFATGPDLVFGVGSGLEGSLGARYLRADFEESDFGTERYSALAALTRQLNSGAELGAHVGTERVKPDDELIGGDEYDLREFFANYSLAGKRTDLSLDAGVTQLERGELSDSGLLLRFDVRRSIGKRMELSVGFGREHSDSGQTLRFQQGITGVDTDPGSLIASPDPFVSQYVTAGLDAFGRRTRLAVSLAHFDQDYPDQPLQDRKELRAGLNVARDLGPTLVATLYGNYLREDFVNFAGDYNELTVGLGLNWQVGRLLYLEMLVDRATRSSDSASTEFDENRAWLRVRFGQTLTRRTTQLRQLRPQP